MAVYRHREGKWGLNDQGENVAPPLGGFRLWKVARPLVTQKIEIMRGDMTTVGATQLVNRVGESSVRLA